MSVRQLSALSGKSLLRYEKDRDRYQIHELLRQFGEGKLDADLSQETKVREKHCAYFCHWLQPLESDLKGRRHRWAMEQIAADLENVRVAWGWAVEQSKVDELAEAVDSLGHFYQRRGDFSDGDRAFEEAAGRLRQQRAPNIAANDSKLRAKTLAKLLAWQGNFQAMLGWGDEALLLYKESLSLLDSPALAEVDVRRERAFALYQSGALKRHSDVAAGGDLLIQCLSLCREIGDRWLESKCLRQLGIVAQASGDKETSEQLHQESLAVRLELGDPAGLAQGYRELGFVALFRGDIERGASLLRQCSDILRQTGELASIANGLRILGFSYFWMGEFLASKESFFQAMAIYKELGVDMQYAMSLRILALTLLHLGAYEQADATAKKALQLNLQVGTANKARISSALTTTSITAMSVGNYKEAERLAEKAMLGFEEIGHRQRMGEALLMWAYASYGLHKFSAARRHALEMLTICVEVVNSFPAISILPLIAILLAEEGQLNRAMQLQALAWHIPLVANSRWLYDFAGRQLESLAAGMSPKELAAAREVGESLDLWKAAAELLEELPRLGWGG